MRRIELLLRINLQKSTLQKFSFAIIAIVMFSALGLSGAYAQTLDNHMGQGNHTRDNHVQTSRGQQFAPHGNFTGYSHAPGGYSSNMGTFSPNGTRYNMNSFNHTKTAYSVGRNFTSHTILPVKSNLISTGVIQSNTASTGPIPSWVKNSAKLWSEKQIADSDFMSGLQYLIQQGILKVPQTNVNSTATAQIPQWLRSNANLWESGQISDSDFIQGIQYLISNGILKQ